jgi:hypothetical protein
MGSHMYSRNIKLKLLRKVRPKLTGHYYPFYINGKEKHYYAYKSLAYTNTTKGF